MSPRVRAAAMLVLVFSAGAMSGEAFRRTSVTRTQRAESQSWAELVRTMELSHTQQRHMDSVFAAFQPRSDALLRELAPRLQALADSIDASLLPVLTPQQREILARARQRQPFVLRRKTPQGERVDTIRLQPDASR